MARREVLEVTCDRCKKTDLQSKDQVKEELELVATFHGKKVEFDDLCTKCRSAVEGYFNRMAKIEEPKKEPAQEKPPEKKRGFLGGGG